MGRSGAASSGDAGAVAGVASGASGAAAVARDTAAEVDTDDLFGPMSDEERADEQAKNAGAAVNGSPSPGAPAPVVASPVLPPPVTAAPSPNVPAPVITPGAGAADPLAALVAAQALAPPVERTPAARDADRVLSPSERSTLKKRFLRTLEPATQRHGRAPKCPENIALEIKSKGIPKQQYFFEMWLKCDEDWAEVEVIETKIKELTVRKGGKRKWMMQHEIRAKHPPLVADAILKAKKSQADQWRANPDCPSEAMAIQYLCIDEEGEEWEDLEKTRSETKLSTTLSKEAGEALLANRLGCALGGGEGAPSQEPSPAGNRGAGVDGSMLGQLRGGQGQPQPAPGQAPQESDAERAARLEKEHRERAAAEEKQAKDAKKAQEKAVKEAQRKSDRDEAKAANDAYKASIEGKAASWVKGLTKEIDMCRGTIKELKQNTIAPGVPATKRNALAKVFQVELNAMVDMRKKLNDEIDLNDNVAACPAMVKSYKEQVAGWKKLIKTYDA